MLCITVTEKSPAVVNKLCSKDIIWFGLTSLKNRLKSHFTPYYKCLSSFFFPPKNNNLTW